MTGAGRGRPSDDRDGPGARASEAPRRGRPPRPPASATPALPAGTAALLAGAPGVADPRWSPDGRRLAWVETGAAGAELVVAPVAAGGPGRRWPVPGLVAGGGLGWATPTAVVVATRDGGLRVVDADRGGTGPPLLPGGTAAGVAVSPDGRLVACTWDRGGTADVAVVPLHGGGRPVVVSTAAWAWDPAWSPDGGRLAWHEWDLGVMPWDASRVAVAAVDGGRPSAVAGGDGEGVGQPRWSPAGDALAWVSDRDGRPAVWLGDPAGGRARVLLPGGREQAEPPWSPGQRSFAFSPDGRSVAVAENEDGFGRLLVVGCRTGAAHPVGRAWHRHLDWGPAGVAAVRSGAVTPPQVVVVAPDGSGRQVVAAPSPAALAGAPLVEPVPFAVPGAAGPVPGLRYPPAPSRPGGPPGPPGRGAPPAVMVLHGGPTGQHLADWSPRVQALAAAGWAVLAPSVRGSTGSGRVWRDALAGRWGEADVDDAGRVLAHAVGAGWVAPGRVAVMGSSAGGMAALLVAAARPDLVAAVVAVAPVTDLEALADAPSRFEAGYLDRLVGPRPAAADRYRARSPVARAGAVRAPVLVLHGDADPVVPPGQSAALVAALRAHGVPVEHHVYPGEGHRWSRPGTVADELVRVADFLRRSVP